MNPRQRRGILFLGLAAAGAIAVFAAVSSYVADVRQQIEPKVNVLVLSTPVEPQQRIDAGSVRTRSIPRKWAPANALHDPIALGEQVSPVPLSAGTVLQSDMLQARPALAEGQVETAILVNADTGVAGKVQPGSIVHIEATYAADARSAPRAIFVVTAAKVISVGTPKEVVKAFGNGSQGNGEQVVPVTFSLSPRDLLRVTYAETFAQEVRLALVREGETGRVNRSAREYSLPAARQRAPR